MLKYLLFAVGLCLASYSYAQKYATPDRVLSEEFVLKVQSSFKEPKVADSLATLLYKTARLLKSPAYSGKGATLLLSTKYLLSEFDKALPWYDTAMIYLQNSNDALWKGNAELGMGRALNKVYRFEKGIMHVLRSIHYFELANDTLMTVKALTSAGVCFHDFENFEKGKKYSIDALTLLAKVKNAPPDSKWRPNNILAINYDDNGEHQKALNIHLRNIKNAGVTNLPITYNNIGNTYQKLNLNNLAKKYFRLSLNSMHPGSIDYDYATIYNNLSRVNVATNDLKLANFYIDSALYYSAKTGSPEKLIDTYETYYMLADKAGNYKQAVAYLKKFTDLKDSLLNKDKAQIIYDLQISYETEKKDRQNQQLIYANKLEKAENNKAQANKNLVLVVAIAALLLISLAFGFIYRNKLIRSKQAEEQAHHKAIFEGEQKERIRIARDLHDSIGQMLAVVKMNVSVLHYQNEADPTINNALTLVDKTITEVRHISHNLLPEGLNFGLFAALQELCEKVNSVGDIEIMLNVPDEVRKYQFAKPSELSIYRIVQEILNNIIKHAEALHVDIDIVQHEHNLTISIKDDGKGFNASQISQFKGIGWNNIAARVNLLDGKMQVQSEFLKGTCIDIMIPQA